MELSVWINNFVAYSLQIAILAAAGTLLAFLFRLRLPRVTLLYWQILLLACLFVPCLQRWEHPVLSPVAGGVRSSSFISMMEIPTNAEFMGFISWEMFALILAAGIFLRLFWLTIGFFRLRLFRHRSFMFLEGHSAVRAMQWCTGVHVPLLLSGEIDSPVTYGFRSPTIILPLSFRDLSEPCQKAVLCHELLHVRRHDWILMMVEEVVCSLFWFHPAIWWMRSRIHLSREQAVDQEVVQLTGSKQPYLDSLLEFAEAHVRLRAVPAPLFLKERHLVQRVALLLKEASMSRSRLAVSMIGISVLLIWTVRLTAGWFPLTGAPVAAQEQSDDLQIKPPQREPLRVGGNIQESKLVHKVDPAYPAQAKREGIQGTVKLTIIVNEEGLVYEIRTSPKNNSILEAAAIDAVKQWQYSPTLLNGEPVPVQASVTIVFQLKDAPLAVEEQNVPSEISVPQGGPIRVGGNAQESKLIRKVEPVYPEEALQARVQGKVVLRIAVNEEGSVTQAEVLQGHPLLNESALAAVRQWRYSPTLLNGVPVPVLATVTVIFNLK
jgi:TonB family protein